jgi:hypothetical protein
MFRCSVLPSVECATLAITIRKLKDLFEAFSKGFPLAGLDHLNEDLQDA